MIQVAFVNHATSVPAATLPPIIRALQLQVGQDFYPAWGINAILTNYVTEPPPATAWVLGLFDTADQANALGYHDVTPTGLPIGKVFARETLASRAEISAVLSHELLEMLGDPYCNLLVQDRSHLKRFWMFENCDAVEEDEVGYQIQGVTVSDFVLPAYFQPGLSLHGPFDFKGHLTGPVPAMTPGGYMAFVEGGRYGQVFGAKRTSPLLRKPGGSGRVDRSQRVAVRSTFAVEAP